MLCLLQFYISLMLFLLICRNHTHFHEQITIRKQFQHLVCPRNHSQVVMRERPVGKVHIPTTILLLVELDTILPFPAQHAPHHHSYFPMAVSQQTGTVPKTLQRYEIFRNLYRFIPKRTKIAFHKACETTFGAKNSRKASKNLEVKRKMPIFATTNPARFP